MRGAHRCASAVSDLARQARSRQAISAPVAGMAASESCGDWTLVDAFGRPRFDFAAFDLALRPRAGAPTFSRGFQSYLWACDRPPPGRRSAPRGDDDNSHSVGKACPIRTPSRLQRSFASDRRASNQWHAKSVHAFIPISARCKTRRRPARRQASHNRRPLAYFFSGHMVDFESDVPTIASSRPHQTEPATVIGGNRLQLS